jgi:hypothetical protein
MKQKQKSITDELRGCGFRVVGKAEVETMPIEANGEIIGQVILHTVTLMSFGAPPISPHQRRREGRQNAQKTGSRV